MQRRKFGSSLKHFALILLASTAPGCGPVPAVAPAVTLVRKWGADFMLGKLADGIWDVATGKPDVRELDRRLARIEEDYASRPAAVSQVQSLRTSIHPDMTLEAYLSLARSCQQQLDRIEKLEVQARDHENRIENLETRPSPSSAPSKQDLDQLDRLDRLNQKQADALRNP